MEVGGVEAKSGAQIVFRASKSTGVRDVLEEGLVVFLVARTICKLHWN